MWPRQTTFSKPKTSSGHHSPGQSPRTVEPTNLRADESNVLALKHYRLKDLTRIPQMTALGIDNLFELTCSCVSPSRWSWSPAQEGRADETIKLHRRADYREGSQGRGNSCRIDFDAVALRAPFKKIKSRACRTVARPHSVVTKFIEGNRMITEVRVRRLAVAFTPVRLMTSMFGTRPLRCIPPALCEAHRVPVSIASLCWHADCLRSRTLRP